MYQQFVQYKIHNINIQCKSYQVFTQLQNRYTGEGLQSFSFWNISKGFFAPNFCLFIPQSVFFFFYGFSQTVLPSSDGVILFAMCSQTGTQQSVPWQWEIWNFQHAILKASSFLGQRMPLCCIAPVENCPKRIDFAMFP